MDVAAPVASTAGMDNDSEQPFRLTDRELLIQVRTHLKYIREDLDTLTNNAAPATVSQDHEKRIRVLEQFRWLILGGAAAAAFLGGLIGRLLGH